MKFIIKNQKIGNLVDISNFLVECLFQFIIYYPTNEKWLSNIFFGFQQIGNLKFKNYMVTRLLKIWNNKKINQNVVLTALNQFEELIFNDQCLLDNNFKQFQSQEFSELL